MSDEYPFIPEYLTSALEDVTIPLIDVMHGYLKVEMLEIEQQIALVEDGNFYSESQDWLEGYMQALTNCYAMTYNLSIDRKIIEERS
ncbi:hypothetical protein UFOVP1491_27 [uncultured Caudovirales phage]|uniref:Uncharacterized protein n=1 Tax=uncultured Caudovirales phage TaxID=2100421 RepID=A0A6J5QYU9_9CAUD|nr:hypothetical protein UFOVP485_94 [uncultured Caudovirales phage]CAB4150896.1 hypothetical protein UFOVP575_46 [uncultured Caudovirales phage]CAB4175075.1 hypothetical protein UFOVP963_114 [uncultured Caudovirales phage]CAB4179632.1 hypothetical protein UFOVP1032_27 [uncultured Caudovirales phage]CAB4185719.1 hypothetical protein UFOVP1125_95 [uncultured Caudovirales phage]